MRPEESFEELWSSLLPVGRQDGGGYRRLAWTDADLEARAWFRARAGERGLDVETDRNGNLWAWWDAGDDQRSGCVCVGSHLDSVADGGAFDGPLGVVSALAAIDLLRARGFRPARPIAVCVFADEEGSRFGMPCTGSRLLAGAIDPTRLPELTDPGGHTLGAALRDAGVDPAALGPEPERLGRIAAFLELHIEQGRGLATVGGAVGLATAIWPHGRWRITLRGRADHAGTTEVGDRHDPMLPLAILITAARAEAGPRSRLTVARVAVVPNGTNAIPARVIAWLDARAADDTGLEASVTGVRREVAKGASEHGVALSWEEESRTPGVVFPEALRRRISRRLEGAGGRPVPALATGAGHDAGILAARVPSAMLFVRNPTGVSHSPAERAEPADCRAGVFALASALEELGRR